MKKIIDTHIHLDRYIEEEIKEIVGGASKLIAVSMDLKSCKRNLLLANDYPNVYPAFGFHPEQELPTDEKFQDLLTWINAHQDEAVAIGEVGLPYYLRENNKLKQHYEKYIECLEAFIILAKELDKPIALHAVYGDAHIVCDLLEKHTIRKAHFHWFKGKPKVIERLIANQYFISVTPDIVYSQKIRELVKKYPLENMMAETDGPWPFEGPYKGKKTRPAMIHHTIMEISKIKQLKPDVIYEKIYANANDFYIVKSCRN